MNYDLSTKEGMANAVRWQQRLVDTLNTHATWAVPRSGTIVNINKETKTATITCMLAPDPSIAHVFRAMGWTAIETDKGESK
jgi:hypothetical protein